MSGSKKVLTTKFIANVAILSAVAFVLMMFDFPLLFIAPSFYKLDFSEEVYERLVRIRDFSCF